MDIFKLKEQVNNYRKLQLYAIDDLTIKESIIYDLKQISHAMSAFCRRSESESGCPDFWRRNPL